MAGARHSAGLLPYRVRDGHLEVFIAHMGGPFWRRRDDGAWSVVKGEFLPGGEEPAAAAVREFREETGVEPQGDLSLLGEFRQPSGKVITLFVADYTGRDLAFVASDEFELEWPRGSGILRSFPEIDAASWFPVTEARRKLVKGQTPILDALLLRVQPQPGPPEG